jgi:cytoskeletal protein RodZ
MQPDRLPASTAYSPFLTCGAVGQKCHFLFVTFSFGHAKEKVKARRAFTKPKQDPKDMQNTAPPPQQNTNKTPTQSQHNTTTTTTQQQHYSSNSSSITAAKSPIKQTPTQHHPATEQFSQSHHRWKPAASQEQWIYNEWKICGKQKSPQEIILRAFGGY